LLGQLGAIVSWDSDFNNPFPECLFIQFGDGYACFLRKDQANQAGWMMKWFLLLLLTFVYILFSTLDLFG
jgi:hypothetical protein